MNREKFIEQLRDGLSGLPESDIADILYDYNEHFEIGSSKGKTQEEIALELGNPQTIAKSYRVNAKITKAEKNPSPSNLIKALLAAMTLGFFNLIFVLGPFLGVIGLLFGLYGISIGFVAGGMGSILSTLAAPFFSGIHIGVHPITSISIGTGLTALGVLLLIGSFYLTKFLYQLTLKYLRWNLDVITK